MDFSPAGYQGFAFSFLLKTIVFGNRRLAFRTFKWIRITMKMIIPHIRPDPYDLGISMLMNKFQTVMTANSAAMRTDE